MVFARVERVWFMHSARPFCSGVSRAEVSCQTPSDWEHGDSGVLDLPGAFTSELLNNKTFFARVANTGPSNENLPQNLREAFSQPDADLWQSALEDELLSLSSNHIYETVPILEGVTPITSKPIFQIKHDHNWKVEWYKLQIIARGFTQHEGVDYQEVFSPVVNLESVRIIVSLVASAEGLKQP